MTSFFQPLKRNLVVEAKEEEMWTVHPTPGLVVKFRDPKLVQPSQRLMNFGSSGSKFFINIAHCMEIPGPAFDLNEVTYSILFELKIAFRMKQQN